MWLQHTSYLYYTCIIYVKYTDLWFYCIFSVRKDVIVTSTCMLPSICAARVVIWPNALESGEGVGPIWYEEALWLRGRAVPVPADVRSKGFCSQAQLMFRTAGEALLPAAILFSLMIYISLIPSVLALAVLLHSTLL